MLKCLTVYIHFSYKKLMQQTNEIKISLKREYNLYKNAMSFYKNILKEFEQKQHLSTQIFLKRFESGQLGDDKDYFDWYAFAKLLSKWRKAQSEIRSAIQWYKNLLLTSKKPSILRLSFYYQTFKNILVLWKRLSTWRAKSQLSIPQHWKFPYLQLNPAKNCLSTNTGCTIWTMPVRWYFVMTIPRIIPISKKKRLNFAKCPKGLVWSNSPILESLNG